MYGEYSTKQKEKDAYRSLYLVIVVFIMLFFSHATTCRKTFSNSKMVGLFVCSVGKCLFMYVSSLFTLLLMLLLQLLMRFSAVLHVQFNRMENCSAYQRTTERKRQWLLDAKTAFFWNFIRQKKFQELIYTIWILVSVCVSERMNIYKKKIMRRLFIFLHASIFGMYSFRQAKKFNKLYSFFLFDKQTNGGATGLSP